MYFLTAQIRLLIGRAIQTQARVKKTPTGIPHDLLFDRRESHGCILAELQTTLFEPVGPCLHRHPGDPADPSIRRAPPWDESPSQTLRAQGPSVNFSNKLT